MNREVTVRIWHGPQVCLLLSVASGGRGYSTSGAVGGAGNSARADIELDPWAGLIVDHRVPYPVPVAIVEEPEPRTDETIGVTLVPEGSAPQPFPPAHKALMIETIEHASLTYHGTGDLRPVDHIADDILTILAGQGWRLIHD